MPEKMALWSAPVLVLVHSILILCVGGRDGWSVRGSIRGSVRARSRSEVGFEGLAFDFRRDEIVVHDLRTEPGRRFSRALERDGNGGSKQIACSRWGEEGSRNGRRNTSVLHQDIGKKGSSLLAQTQCKGMFESDNKLKRERPPERCGVKRGILRLRGGISKSAKLSKAPNEMIFEDQEDLQEEGLGGNYYDDDEDDSAELAHVLDESQEETFRTDPRKRMNVGALVAAQKDEAMHQYRLDDGAGMGNQAWIDAEVKKLYKAVRKEVREGDASDSDWAKDNYLGMPVPACYQDVVEQQKVEKRYREHKMSARELGEYLEQEERDNGIITTDDYGNPKPLDFLPKLGRLPDPFGDDVYPKEELLYEQIMTHIREHIRNCISKECEHDIGRDEDWWAERIIGMTYFEKLQLYRELPEYDFPAAYWEDQHQHHLCDGEYVRDADLTDFAWDNKYNVSRCVVVPDMPFCDVCQDAEIANVQISEGAIQRLCILFLLSACVLASSSGSAPSQGAKNRIWVGGVLVTTPCP